MDFKSVHVVGKTLGDVWFSLLSELNEKGRRGVLVTNGSHAGSMRVEFDAASGFVEYPHQRPLAPILPPSVNEVPTNDDKINYYFQEYVMNPNKTPQEEYRYSEWINGPIWNTWKRRYQTPVEWVIDHFNKAGKGNNHCYITVGSNDFNFRYDKPFETEMERGTSPCLRGLDFKVKDGQLLTGVIYRSWDLYSGWPENMGGFTLLNEYIASMINVEPGPLSFYSMGLHCYDHEINAMMKVLNKSIGE